MADVDGPEVQEPSSSASAEGDSQARLAAIIDSAMDAIISTDSEQRIVLFNAAAEKMFGWTTAQVLGRSLDLLIPEKSRPVHPRYMRRFGETGQTNRAMGRLGKISARRSTGEEFPIEASISHTATSQGSVFTVIVRDITERVRFEEALLEKESSLRAAAEENARLFAQAESRLNFLSSLRTIDLAISSTPDLRIVLNTLLDQIVSQLSVDAAAVFLTQRGLPGLEYVDGRGLLTSQVKSAHLAAQESCAAQSVLRRGIVYLAPSDVAKLKPSARRFFKAEKIQSCLASPLIAKGRVEGVLVVFFRAVFEPDPEWESRLEALSGQAAIALNSAMLWDDLQRSNHQLLQAYDATIEGWSRALDLRDHETEDHTRRVTAMTLKLAGAAGQFSEEELLYIRWGALLHDIGKMGVPDTILFKPGDLTDEERLIVQKHPAYAYELLYPIEYLRKALDIPRYHHEQWDGKGYPYGLKGEEIPLAARLFSVVDVWDALNSKRVYHQGRWDNESQVIEYLTRQAGAQFDPAAVEAFLKVFVPQSGSPIDPAHP